MTSNVPPASERPRLVAATDDDELRHVLTEALGSTYELVLATDTASALRHLDAPPFADVLVAGLVEDRASIALLAYAREKAPLATRLLITKDCHAATGQAAINDAHAHSWLVRPLAASTLEEAVRRAHTASREEHDRCLAREAATLRTKFIAATSHKARTPLNGVLGMADLLLETKLDDEQRHFAEVIRKSGNNLLKLFDEVLATMSDDLTKRPKGAHHVS